MGHVLVSPLNWGLGHATRNIPVIRELLHFGHEVVVAATGNALLTLRREFPDCRFIDAPDYPAPYDPGNLMLARVLTKLPEMLKALAAERRCIRKIVAKDRYDLIISDSRPGMYSDTVPSVFMTHQVHYHLPFAIWPVELLGLGANRVLFDKYRRVIVPDNPPGPTALAGKLSHPICASSYPHLYFTGILATARRIDLPQDLDYLFIISGPEPQRTIFERIMLPQLHELPGIKAVLLGSPGGQGTRSPDPQTMVASYASTEEKIALLNRAKFIVCRSGYTTMMELAEIGKKHALFVPTPGQTEQEYLSNYYRKQGWFFSQAQDRLDLPRDIAAAAGYTGFPDMPKTAGNARRLYEEVLSAYVE
ncbi:MAG: UDP-N-acetylglucosamine--N-acetylmuramyl-(pentapeptide) pyrophosphoryl-undecaprenol N-acetylglucosamine transferase [Methanoregula sp. PtaU1.Bin051]|nr:MAG: UDP-N-acetylglucosamine--N-acetylmuramyl-(pentapeptide) pyrophosphoryl-undecaprenol N-acetylglucosamine transferase [Methanoregula sp. PtaU1.Bin051]